MGHLPAANSAGQMGKQGQLYHTERLSRPPPGSRVLLTMPSLAGQTRGLEGDSRIPEGLHSGRP